MNEIQANISRQEWRRVTFKTLTITIFANVVMLVASGSSMIWLQGAIDPARIYVGLTITTALAVPIVGYLMVMLQKLRFANDQLEIIAATDYLTGCMNRRAFTSQMNAYISPKNKSEAISGGAFFLIDADNFKQVNDNFGHDAGDDALIRIVGAIQSQLREEDLLGRLGGEEFGCFLPNISAVETVAIAERIRAAVNAIKFNPNGEAHRLSVSVGAEYSDGAASFACLYDLADRQLYAAKHSGRNRVEFDYARKPLRVIAEDLHTSACAA